MKDESYMTVNIVL